MSLIRLIVLGLTLVGSVSADSPIGATADPVETLRSMAQERGRIEANLEFLKGGQEEISALQFPDLLVGPQGDYLEAQRALQVLQLAGLGPKHPKVIEQEKIVAERKARLDETVDRFRRDLQLQLQRVIEDERALRESMENTTEIVVPTTDSETVARLNQAEAEYAKARKDLDELRIQLIAESMNSHREESVIVHAEAEDRTGFSWFQAALISGGSGLIVLLLMGLIAFCRKTKPALAPPQEPQV